MRCCMRFIYKIAFLIIMACGSINVASAAVVDLKTTSSIIDQPFLTHDITNENTLNLISATANLIANDIGNNVKNDVMTIKKGNFNNHAIFFALLILVLYCAIKIMDVHSFKQR